MKAITKKIKKSSKWKKPLAFGLAFTMMFSLTACGGKGGNSGSSNDSAASKVDVKDVTFSGTELELKDVKGDPNSFMVANDRIYFYTMEWPDMPEEAYSNDVVEENSESVANAGDNFEEENTEEDVAASDSSEENTEEQSSDSDNEEASTEAGNDDASTETGNEDSSEEDNAEETATEEFDGNPQEYNPVTRIYSMAMDGSDIKELCTPQIENNEYINFILVDKSGKLFVITSSWDEKTEINTYTFMELDDSGNAVNRQDITKAAGFGQDDYLSRIILNDDGGLIIATDQKIMVFDSSFNKTNEVKTDNVYIEGIAKALDGTIVCGTTDEKGAVAQVVDLKENKLSEKFSLDISYFNSSDALMNGSGEYDFYYKDNAGVYGYSIKDKKSTKLMDFMASEVSSDNVYNLIPIDSETMLAWGWNEQGSVINIYKKVDPSTVKDKTTITYGSLWGVDDNIRNAAMKFNKENDKYRIEFMDYSNAGEEAQTKMNADIVAGKVPDIIDLNNLPVHQYISKGILEDLTPYYEKDADVTLDDILPSVVKSTSVDGKQYYVTPSFNISTLIAASKDVGGKTGWTFDEMKQLLDSKGPDARPFYSENKNDILYSFLYGCVDDYIDWTTGKCRFDSNDFKSILEISNRGINEEVEYNEDSPSQPSLIKSGKVLFTEGYIDVESVQLYSSMYNQDITFIGYPSEDRQGSYFSFDNALGIYSKSDVKDGAWEFIKTFMTMEYQATQGHIWSVPTNKVAFEMYMKTKTATKAYKDELGQDIEPLDSSWGWDDLEVKIGPLSSKEEKMYRDLIDGVTKVNTNNYEVMDIITEEAKAYFAGQKGLDETADIIQNRVTTFVNENR